MANRKTKNNATYILKPKKLEAHTAQTIVTRALWLADRGVHPAYGPTLDQIAKKAPELKRKQIQKALISLEKENAICITYAQQQTYYRKLATRPTKESKQSTIAHNIEYNENWAFSTHEYDKIRFPILVEYMLNRPFIYAQQHEVQILLAAALIARPAELKAEKPSAILKAMLSIIEVPQAYKIFRLIKFSRSDFVSVKNQLMKYSNAEDIPSVKHYLRIVNCALNLYDMNLTAKSLPKVLADDILTSALEAGIITSPSDLESARSSSMKLKRATRPPKLSRF